jgi:predicted nucleic acid-binding protein
MRSGEEDKTERLLRSLRFYEVTWQIAKLAGSLQNHWRQQGRTLALPDATIAAVAVANKLVLVTNNTRDFPMPELTLYPAP